MRIGWMTALSTHLLKVWEAWSKHPCFVDVPSKSTFWHNNAWSCYGLQKTRHLGFQPTHGIRRLFKVTMPPWLEIKSKHVTHRVNIQKLSWSLVASAAVNPGRPWSCSGVQSAFGPESWRNFNLLYSPQDGLAAPYATCPLAAKRNIQNMHFRIQQNVKW